MDLLPHVLQLSIIDKRTNRIVPLREYIKWPQELLVNTVSRNLTNGDPTRIIVLKARQLGFSTITKGIEFTLGMMFDNFRSLTISHEAQSNQHLLNIGQTYFDNYPFKPFYTQTGKAANQLKFDPTGSTFKVVTAKNLGGGRSQTPRFLHGSEVAFWPDAGTLLSSIGPAMPKSAMSFIILESTANGIGNYYETTWNDAVSGRNDYIPIFIPWQVDPEYTAERIGRGIPPLNPDTDGLDEEETRLLEQFKVARIDAECQAVLARTMSAEQVAELSAPMPHDEIMSRLAWRRYIINNELAKRKDGTNPYDVFLQEYPDCPRVAFLISGSNVFPLPYLQKVHIPMRGTTGDIMKDGGRHRFQEQSLGPLRIFRYPSENNHYIVGVDPTFTTGGDYGCIQVLNRRTWEQVAVYRAKIDAAQLGAKACEIGWFYNEAMLVPEVNNDGSTALGRIQGLDYPNVWQRQVVDSQNNYASNKIGWFTNTRTKHEAIGNLKALIIDRSVTIHDDQTFRELKSYVDLGMGRYGNANGEPNDDTVMSLAIAATVNAYEADEIVAVDRATRAAMSDMTQKITQMQEQVLRSGGIPVGVGRGGDDDGDW